MRLCDFRKGVAMPSARRRGGSAVQIAAVTARGHDGEADEVLVAARETDVHLVTTADPEQLAAGRAAPVSVRGLVIELCHAKVGRGFAVLVVGSRHWRCSSVARSTPIGQPNRRWSVPQREIKRRWASRRAPNIRGVASADTDYS